MSRNYRQLKVWELAHLMTKEIYKITQKFPKQEIFGLVSQMRRASVSIPANNAEGSGRKSKKDFYLLRLLHVVNSVIIYTSQKI
ncbi:MAG: four helix bundle protein [candidate division WOR-3 bacterium]|nr:four helix bundle protein [candidate division WOR-3 bacterium]